MSGAISGTLDCRVAVSGCILLFNRCIHAAALAVVLALSVYRPALLLLVPLIALSHYRALRAIRLRRRDSIHRLRWTSDDEWLWQQNDGREVRGRLLDATILGHHAVMLRLRAEQQRLGTKAVLLAADSLAPDTHRRLRVRLTLWQGADRDIDFTAALQERLSGLRAALQRRR